MNRELLILFWVFIFCVFLLIRVVPKSRIKEAQLVFIFVQSVTWVYNYVQIALGIIEFPFRIFPKASDMGFTLHYFIYPTIAVFFIFSYPPVNKKLKIITHYLIFSFVLVGYVVAIEKYSNLIEFKSGWKWYIIVIVVLLIFTITKLFHSWFMKGTTRSGKYRAD